MRHLFLGSFSCEGFAGFAQEAFHSRAWPAFWSLSEACWCQKATRDYTCLRIPTIRFPCPAAWSFRSYLSRRPTSGHLPEEGPLAKQQEPTVPAGTSYFWLVPCPCQDWGCGRRQDGSPIRLCGECVLDMGLGGPASGRRATR